MANNIFQIWETMGKQTPFAVIRDHWKDGHYVIVQRVECDKMPYGKAFGIPSFNGRYSDRLEYDTKWEKTGLIPCCGCYQWTLVPNVDLSVERPAPEGRKGHSDERVKTGNCILRFGKFNGRTVAQAFAEQPSYLAWLIENVEPFILEPSTIDELESEEYRFPEKAKLLNQQKLALLDA